MGYAAESVPGDRLTINEAEYDMLRRLEEGVVTAFAEWFNGHFSVPLQISFAGVTVLSTAEALAQGTAPQRLLQVPFRLEKEEKQLFCIPEAGAQKLLARLPQNRTELQSPDFLILNYERLVGKQYAEASLAQPVFLPARSVLAPLQGADLPPEPFLRFDYDLAVEGESLRLTRFASMRLLSTIRSAPMNDQQALGTKSNPTADLKDEPHVERVEFAPLAAEKPPSQPAGNLEMLYDLHVDVIAELGRTRMQLRDILALGRGSIVELHKLAGDPVELFVNDKKLGEGEVVVVDDHFGIRIMNLITANDRIKNLGE